MERQEGKADSQQVVQGAEPPGQAQVDERRREVHEDRWHQSWSNQQGAAAGFRRGRVRCQSPPEVAKGPVRHEERPQAEPPRGAAMRIADQDEQPQAAGRQEIQQPRELAGALVESYASGRRLDLDGALKLLKFTTNG